MLVPISRCLSTLLPTSHSHELTCLLCTSGLPKACWPPQHGSSFLRRARSADLLLADHPIAAVPSSLVRRRPAPGTRPRGPRGARPRRAGAGPRSTAARARAGSGRSSPGPGLWLLGRVSPLRYCLSTHVEDTSPLDARPGRVSSGRSSRTRLLDAVPDVRHARPAHAGDLGGVRRAARRGRLPLLDLHDVPDAPLPPHVDDVGRAAL